jgi:hypothetical protein
MNKKAKNAIIFGIPVLVGLYFIYKQFAKPKASDKRDVIPPNPPSPEVIPDIQTKSDFPLKKGSKNKSVGTLQSLLNTSDLVTKKLDPDNNFGSLTEGALLTVYGKKQINDAADLNALRKKLSSLSEKSSNLDWAWKLIEAQNSSRYSNLTVSSPINLIAINKNFQGVWKPTGKQITLPRSKYTLNDYVLQSALTDGTLRIEVNKGDLAGMYTTPVGANLSSIFDIT